ncbi:hypothetical protein AB0B94_31235 [Micromonospora sp. NPDC048986]|uniref:hypothetical protein n=1 Tax=Micromonospora sp. NPDC048986 TaxID=3155644 RepID=UPI0033C95050
MIDVWHSTHSRKATPEQQAAIDAYPYRFRVTYSYTANSGSGRADVQIGSENPSPALDDSNLAQKIHVMTASAMREIVPNFDPRSLTIEIMSIEPTP